MPPGDGKLKSEDEIILAVVLSVVGFAIVSFTYYKIHTKMKRLKLQQQREQQDLERNGPPPGGGVGRGGGGEDRQSGGAKNKGLSERDDSYEKKWTAANLAPKASMTSATDNQSRRSLSSDTGGSPKLYVEHKVELEGDMKAPDEIDGIGLSAAKDKTELEGSGPPIELPAEPMRFSWVGGLGTGTMGSSATMRADGSLARSPSDVSDTTTLFRYTRRPSYALRVPIKNYTVEEDTGEKEASFSEGDSRPVRSYRCSSSASGYLDGEVSPISPVPRSIRAFSLDGTVVEAQGGGDHEDFRQAAATSSVPLSAGATYDIPVQAVEPMALRRDKWKVWRALAEDARRKQ